jgi:hypothetical protein
MDSLQVTEEQSSAVAVAPRVTLDSMEAKIASESYVVHEGILTICIIKMANGFYVTGESAPASPANFNADLGRKFAREQAMRKLWVFEGYALRERLSA